MLSWFQLFSQLSRLFPHQPPASICALVMLSDRHYRGLSPVPSISPGDKGVSSRVILVCLTLCQRQSDFSVSSCLGIRTNNTLYMTCNKHNPNICAFMCIQLSVSFTVRHMPHRVQSARKREVGISRGTSRNKCQCPLTSFSSHQNRNFSCPTNQTYNMHACSLVLVNWQLAFEIPYACLSVILRRVSSVVKSPWSKDTLMSISIKLTRWGKGQS